jgi:hypothetical protein
MLPLAVWLKCQGSYQTGLAVPLALGPYTTSPLSSDGRDVAVQTAHRESIVSQDQMAYMRVRA